MPSTTVESTIESGAVGMVAGRDVIGVQYNENAFLDDSGFSSLRFDDEWYDAIETPAAVDEIRDALVQRKLSILGGPLLREKAALARHVAWWTLESPKDSPVVQARQRRCGIADVPLDKVLRDTEDPTLFVLWDAEPRHLEHDLRRVLGWLEEGPHRLLVTSDSSAVSFGLEDSSPLRHLWCPVTTGQVYDADYRARLLIASLSLRCSGSLPAELFPQGERPPDRFVPTQPLVEGLEMREAVNALETPEQIVLLVRFLLDPPALLDAASTRLEIGRITGDRSAIEGWYRRLSPREQLLASGVVFFEGLFDDQLFAALDLVVEKAWRPRQPMLDAFDYHDLDGLDRYVRFPRSSVGGEPVECRSEVLRQSLLAAAWRYRRRQMMVILPLVSDLICRSGKLEWNRRLRGEGRFAPPEEVPERSGDEATVDQSTAAGELHLEGAEGLPVSHAMPYGPERELLGLAPRRQRLHSVVRRSLAELGLLSPYAVERCLYEMASDGSWEAQSVAAQTLWSWRRTPRESRMFQILKSWHGEARGVERGAREVAPTAADYVQKTVALTIFYAAVGDPPDDLHEDAVLLLTRLSDERSRQRRHHPVVRDRVRRQTLPVAVQWHLGRLEPELRRLIGDPELIEPIAVGWARSLASRPKVALPLLSTWRQPAPTVPGAAGPLDTGRELRIATAALTYGLIDYRDRRVPLSPADGAVSAGELLVEPHPFVRWHVFRTLERLILRHFEEIEEPLRDAVERISVGERLEILRPLFRIARDRSVPLGLPLPPSAADPERPRIDTGSLQSVVAGELERWLCDETRPVAQQFALEALTVLAAGDLAEESQTSAGSARNARSSFRGTGQAAALRRAPWLARLLLWLTTVGRPDLRVTCAAPVGELMHQLETRPRGIQSVLAGAVSTGPAGSILTTLRRVATWHQRRRATWVVLAILGMLILVALSIAGAAGGA